MARYIDADRLYALVDQAHDIAIKGLLDTPKTLENGELNPMYIRYLTLVAERAHIKEEIFNAPAADEEKIATEYCMKRFLVMMTMDTYEKLIACYNRCAGLQDERRDDD